MPRQPGPPPKFFKYVGGKTWLRPLLLRLFDRLVVDELASPFLGSGVFEYAFARARPDVRVRTSDISAPLVNFHAAVRRRRNELKQLLLAGEPTMERAEYDALQLRFAHMQAAAQAGGDDDDEDDSEEGDARAAADFARMMQNSYSGKYGSYCRSVFRVLPTRALRLPAPPNLECTRREALAVLRTGLGAKDDDDDSARPGGVAWYLDPPYWTPEEHYLPGNNLRFAHEALAALLLARPRARWVLSYNAAPRVVELYGGGGAVVYEVPRMGERLRCEGGPEGLGGATELLILSPAAAKLADDLLAGSLRRA
jgi:site-specific DNA-adenine methylase